MAQAHVMLPSLEAFVEGTLKVLLACIEESEARGEEPKVGLCLYWVGVFVCVCYCVLSSLLCFLLSSFFYAHRQGVGFSTHVLMSCFKTYSGLEGSDL